MSILHTDESTKLQIDLDAQALSPYQVPAEEAASEFQRLGFTATAYDMHKAVAAQFRRDLRRSHRDLISEIRLGNAAAKEHAINVLMDEVRLRYSELETLARNDPDPNNLFLALCRLKCSAYESTQFVRALLMIESTGE